MSDKVFIDSNIILYAFSKDEIEKSKTSNSLIFNSNDINISKQVIETKLKIINPFFQVKG